MTSKARIGAKAPIDAWGVQEFVDAIEAWRRRRLLAPPGLGWERFAPTLLWELAHDGLNPDVIGALTLPVFDWSEEPMRHLNLAQWRELFKISGYRELDDTRVRSGVLATPANRPPKPLRLYRGATPQGKRGMSWTTAQEVAEIFAEAAETLTSRQAGIYTATVDPRRLLGRRVGMEFGSDEYVVDTRGLQIRRLRASAGRLVRCSCGETHWGAHGAAGLLLVHRSPDDRTEVLLERRGPTCQHAGSWGIPGGAMEPGETALACALREAQEEVGIDATEARVLAEYVDDHGPWSYTTIVVETGEALPPVADGHEVVAARWVDVTAVRRMQLHPALRVRWPELLTLTHVST